MRLTGARAGPNRSRVIPSGESERVTPHSDAGKEVDLSIGLEVVVADIDYAPLIDIARRDMACTDEISQPLRGIRIDLVVVSGHFTPPPA